MADDNILKNALQEKFPDSRPAIKTEQPDGSFDGKAIESAPRFEQAEQLGTGKAAESASFAEGGGSIENRLIGSARTQTPAASVRTKQIETVLEDGLIDFYKAMPPDLKTAFKQKGEETAVQISAIMEKAKFSISEIIGVVRKWLEMIPGVNKFFLEQEAKIKADKIMSIR